MSKKKENLTLTYLGIFDSPDKQDTVILGVLMRHFQSSKRFSRERIFEGLTRKEVEEKTKKLFIPNSRYMRDAFLEAEASISSQKELLPLYVTQNNAKLQKVTKEIEKLKVKKPKNKKQQHKLEQDLLYTGQSKVLNKHK